MIKKVMSKFSKQNKMLKKYSKNIGELNKKYNNFSNLNDDEIKKRFDEIKNNNEITLDNKLEVLSLIREMSERILKMRPFDVQLIGALVINDGKIAEMKTGEGKTLVATISAIVTSLTEKKIHIITANNYLAERDCNDMKPLYNFFDIDVDYLVPFNDFYGDRSELYNKQVLYTMNDELAFDYLRNNLAKSIEEKYMGDLNFAIIDEIDSILIDRARSPFVISQEDELFNNEYLEAEKIARLLKNDVHYKCDFEKRFIDINDEGYEEISKLYGIINIHTNENIHKVRSIENALQTKEMFKKDKEYIVRDGEILLISQETGRIVEGQSYSNGIQQALQAKENLEIKPESINVAEITSQNFFNLYKNKSGMTGTASNESGEFLDVYNLEIIEIPTNVKIKRKDLNDLIFMSKEEKNKILIEKIKELHDKEVPILLGTLSVEESEEYDILLSKHNLEHETLNAKNHKKEAEIIEKAGEKGSITVVTSMAGRGVDIKISREVENMGGLHILSTGRYENRRIDDQLRGRSGRQGDSGETQFYLSLDDELLVIFGGEKLKSIMKRIGGVEFGESIDSGMITKAVRKSQKKLEEMHYESRKEIKKYDVVLSEQSKIYYEFRDKLIFGKIDLNDRIKEQRVKYIEEIFFKSNIINNQAENDDEIEVLIKNFLETLNINFDKEFFKHNEEFNTLENIVDALEKLYENKFIRLSEQDRKSIESQFFLETIDKQWAYLKSDISNLQEGINLRQYNQKDPLVEFKKESYQMFLSFKEEFQKSAVITLDSIQIQIEEIEEEIEENGVINKFIKLPKNK